MQGDWRRVEFRIPVFGSPAFFHDPGPGLYDLSQAFHAEVVGLRGRVRGPTEQFAYEVEVEVSAETTMTVVIAMDELLSFRSGTEDHDQRALCMAGSILRSPLAARRRLLYELEQSARWLLPQITKGQHGRPNNDD